MEQAMILGDPKTFAIELADFQYGVNEGRIRFWIHGSEFGNLELTDELVTCALALKKIITEKEDLFDNEFVTKTEVEIFQLCFSLEKNLLALTNEEIDRLRPFRKFSPFLGEQFDTVAMIIFYKNGFYHILWSYNNDYTSQIDYMENFKFDRVKAEHFENPCNELIQMIKP